MATLRQRTRLELAALLALVVTAGTIVVVASGLLRNDRSETARRVTAACRPIATAITHEAPRDITRRDLTRLRQETSAVAEELRTIAKDARGEARAHVLRMVDRMEFASDEFSTLISIKQRAQIMTTVGGLAAEFGAACPSPLTEAEGDAVDRAQAAAKAARR